MILNEFAVDAEATVVVEVEGVRIAVWGRLRSGRPGRWWVVGLSWWRRGIGLGSWSGKRFLGLGKWRVRSDPDRVGVNERRVGCGKSRFLALLPDKVGACGMTI